MTKSRAFLAATVFAATLVVPKVSAAIERQHHVGLAPNLAVLAIEDKSTASVGAGATLHYAYGLTDQWNLMVEAGSAVVALDQDQDTPETPRTRPGAIDHASVGFGYVIDILRWVPYVGVMGGVYRFGGGTLPQALYLPAASFAAGLDYQLSRHFAVGVAGRQHMMLGELETYPSYTTVLLRFETMWGF